MANLWVDDLRPKPNDKWDWAKSSTQAIWVLKCSKSENYQIPIMSLDHDLGGDDTTRPVVIWMCENDYWPTEIRIHTSNPPGRDWLQGMIDRYKP